MMMLIVMTLMMIFGGSKNMITTSWFFHAVLAVESTRQFQILHDVASHVVSASKEKIKNSNYKVNYVSDK